MPTVSRHRPSANPRLQSAMPPKPYTDQLTPPIPPLAPPSSAPISTCAAARLRVRASRLGRSRSHRTFEEETSRPALREARRWRRWQKTAAGCTRAARTKRRSPPSGWRRRPSSWSTPSASSRRSAGLGACRAPARAAATGCGDPSTTCSCIWPRTGSCQTTRCGCSTSRASAPSLLSRPTTTPVVVSKCRNRRRLRSGRCPCLRRTQEASYGRRIRWSGPTRNTCGSKRKPGGNSNRVHQRQRGCSRLLKRKGTMSASQILNLKIQ